MDIFKEIKSLGFPEDKFIVMGGASMAAYGLREAKDIDIFVAPEIFERCKKDGWDANIWKGRHDGAEVEWLRKGHFELYAELWYQGKSYSIEELLPYCEKINDVYVQPIYWLMNFKKDHGRPKDLVDAGLIESFLLKRPDLVIEPK